MRIVNVMIGKAWGGIEQAFVDYCDALDLKEHPVFAITDIRGQAKDKIRKDGNIQSLSIKFSRYNWFVVPGLYLKLRAFKPDLIIIHSKKAIPMFKFLARLLKIKVVGVAHNPKFKLINQCDGIFSITQYQKDIFISKGFDQDHIFVIPNLIKEERVYKVRKFNEPPVVGVIGRFDPMKGFSDFVRALDLLKQEKIAFKAIIGGSATKNYQDEYEMVRGLVKEKGLQNEVEFLGWINDKDDFYDQIDIFVLPSNFEPFGIVLLEAMVRSIPVVSSLAEGPKEIYSKTKAAYTFPVNNFEGMAKAIKEALADEVKSQLIARNGFDLVGERYSLKAVADKLDVAIKTFM